MKNLMRRHLSAGGLVMHRGAILLVRNRNGHWGLPKGHWETGEVLAETAVREVLEETGLHVSVQDLAFVTEFKNVEGKEHLVQFFFEAALLGGQLAPQPEEISSVKWVRTGAIAAYIRWRPWLEPLQHWLAGGKMCYHQFPNPAMNRIQLRM